MTKFSLRLVTLINLLWLLQAPFPVFAGDIYTFSDKGGAKYYTNIPSPGRTKVSFPLVIRRVGSSGRVVSTDLKMHDYESLINKACASYSVDPDLVRAVIKVESNFNNRAISPKGALGLMQLMPQTARGLGVADPLEPASNIYGGVMYLSMLLDILKGDLPLSLAAYNAGLERVIEKKEVPAISETKDYVKRVLNYYSKLKGY